MTRAALMTGGAAIFAAITPAASWEQSDTAPQDRAEPGATTGEIIVTARKREERLVDVPGPITALSPTQITDARLQEPRDLLLQIRPIVSSPVSVQKIAAPSTAFAPLVPTASM